MGAGGIGLLVWEGRVNLAVGGMEGEDVDWSSGSYLLQIAV